MMRSTEVRRRPARAVEDGAARRRVRGGGHHSPPTGPATRQTSSRATTFSDDRDHQQDQAERDQARGLQPDRRLVERRRDLGGDRLRLIEQTRRDVLAVPDDHRHRHRLAERAAKAEDHRADDARPRVRQHRLRDRSPSASPRAPSIASRCGSGTAAITSREIATIVGRIMIARITPAENSPMPTVGPAKNGIQPSVPDDPDSTVSRQERREDEHPPQAVDDARDRGEQLDHEGQRHRDRAGRELGQEDRREQCRSVPRGRARCSDDSSVPTMNGSAP